VMQNLVEAGIGFEILKFGDWVIAIWVLCEEDIGTLKTYEVSRCRILGTDQGQHPAAQLQR
jgi:hypothetical protein